MKYTNKDITSSADISDSRKSMYYLGMLISGIGLFVFIGSFFVFALSMTGASGGPERFMTIFVVDIFAFIAIIVGNIIRTIGARGMAGSGMILDPKQARQDLKPYSQMVGGMIKDGLQVTGIAEQKPTPKMEPKTVVKIRCPQCRTLNDEDAKFCDNCGQQL